MSETGKFTEDILAVAKEKAQTIVNEAETETQRALEQSKAHSSREAAEILSRARAEAEVIKLRKISEVRHRLKLVEQSEKGKMLTEVLEQTKARTVNIVKDENKYFDYLVSMIAGGVRQIGLDYAVVRLNAHDLKGVDLSKLEQDTVNSLGRSVEIEFSREPIQALGGAIVTSKDGRTCILNTLDQRFEAIEPRLLVEAGKILFGDSQ
jgi:vacuolar-type H+-ATPase subunit E/Vma4